MDNVGIYTEKELVDRCWDLGDPLLRRLCEIIDRYHQMSEDSRHMERIHFDKEQGWCIGNETLDNYVHELESDRDYYQEQCQELEEKVQKLSVRTVVELLEIMNGKLEDHKRTITRLSHDLESANQKEKDALEKLDMWTSLNRVYESAE